ncbi:serotonin N-acetyltransferase-like isoform X2 [Hemiscyllium ocellatum]|uniref:serotonin N-acetyltransferase-like isoform X2 n=1 Tax=Hemiscyllium ocellatum TaxID=170820 RepID=UPI0029668BB0|nr:serotonin N-acetyltransferase-like isoform X2 [Hemiscyllium ocellatum]
MQGAVGELRTLSEGDVAAAWALEAAGYPPEEAASLAKLQYRQREAGELFLGHFVDDQLIGFVCGTRSLEDHLTEESMDVHEPTGTTICIHSVCVDGGLYQKVLQNSSKTNSDRTHSSKWALCETEGCGDPVDGQ